MDEARIEDFVGKKIKALREVSGGYTPAKRRWIDFEDVHWFVKPEKS